jgi:hypothetical protein
VSAAVENAAAAAAAAAGWGKIPCRGVMGAGAACCAASGSSGAAGWARGVGCVALVARAARARAVTRAGVWAWTAVIAPGVGGVQGAVDLCHVDGEVAGEAEAGVAEGALVGLEVLVGELDVL